MNKFFFLPACMFYSLISTLLIASTQSLSDKDKSSQGMWPIHDSHEKGSQEPLADSYLDYTTRLKKELMNSTTGSTGIQTPSLSTEDIVPGITAASVQVTPSANQKTSTSKTVDVSNNSAQASQKQTSSKNGNRKEEDKNGEDKSKGPKVVSVNFNNVAMIEYIHFISRISGKNFIFDDNDLQFNVTIVSEESTTVENLMTALLQELKIRDLALMEQGNNLIIHRNPRVRSPARVVNEGVYPITTQDSELVTRVFRLNTLDPTKASAIIRPLLSDDAIVEVLEESNNIIITDLVITVNRVAELINKLDAPNSGMSIGQYYVRSGYVDSLVELGTKILQPLAQGNPFVLIPHIASSSIFIVSNSFLVEKAMAILQNLDNNEGKTKIFSLDSLQLYYDGQKKTTAGQFFPGGLKLTPEEAAKLKASGINIEEIIDSIFWKLTPEERAKLKAAGINLEEILNSVYGRLSPEEQMRLKSKKIDLEGMLGIVYGKITAEEASKLKAAGIDLEGVISSVYAKISPEEREKLQSAEIGLEGIIGNLYEKTRIFESAALGSEGSLKSVFKQVGGVPLPENLAPGKLESEGRQSAIFSGETSLTSGSLRNNSKYLSELPVGHIERTMFFIYKLKYRKGDGIQIALQKIATSLATSGTANVDLISAINSSQWIESSNALIFTGMPVALERIRELILEVDVPLRQVYIEMLILDTTITDSLTYSVDWINRFGGGLTTGEQGFNTASGNSANFIKTGELMDNPSVQTLDTPASPIPVATGLLNLSGFAAGVIGTHLTHNGTCFSSIGALIRAIHLDSKSNILLNPKIITEDNNPAEVFVGGTDRYKTQSIGNDQGNLVTNNYQFIDVGTTLRVTPLIGSNGIITLEIVQERTAAAPGANDAAAASAQDINLVEVLTKTRAVTKIHVPNGFFVIFSGMIQDHEVRSTSQIPCLGGIPLIGCIGKSLGNQDDKRNLMLFIRPLIIDTDEDYEEITKRQQDVYREKCKFRRSWKYETDEGLNFLNLKATDPDEARGSLER